ncbi:MAG: sulfite exporter TauE/SafE family protein [Candidatus Spechtbacterales bacterium]
MSVELLFIIIILVFFAAAMGTFSGFGISTIMVPVMLLFFPLPLTLLFTGTIHWFEDIWKMLLFRSGVGKWKLVLWFAVPGVIAGFFGATVSVSFPEEFLLRILGGFILAYVIFILWKPEWKLPERNSVAGVGGALSGFSSGIFGVGGEIRATFLSAFNLPKEAYLFALGAMGLAIDSARIAGYLATGARLEGLFLWGLALFIPASLLGAWTAKYFVDRVPQKYFRVFIALFLAVVAVKFLIFP